MSGWLLPEMHFFANITRCYLSQETRTIQAEMLGYLGPTSVIFYNLCSALFAYIGIDSRSAL